MDHIAAYKRFLIGIKPRDLKNLDKEAIDKLYFIFNDIFQILSDTTAIEDRARLLLTDTLGIWMVRIRQWVEIVRHLQSLDDNQALLLQKLNTHLLTQVRCDFLFRYVIDFWNESGAALANSLDGLLHKLLHLVKLVRVEEDYQVMLRSWLSETLQIPYTMRVLYYLTHVLAPEVDVLQILESRPDFIEHSLGLMWTESLATPIGKCIASILINAYNRHYRSASDLDAWFSLWERSTMHFFQNPRMRKRIEICILVPVFTTVKENVFNHFISRNFQRDSPELIPILKIGQELSLEEEPFHDDKLVSLSFMEQLLRQDQYKLPVFELLTFATKKSMPVASYIYDIIKRNMNLFFVDIEVKCRNEFRSLFKKFIDRIRDSTYSLNRDSLKLQAKNKFPEEQAQKRRMISEAIAFMDWLVQFLKSQIIPGSQYQRQILATKLLKTLVSSSLDPNIPKLYLDPRLVMNFPFNVFLSDDRALGRLLLDNLTDNYNDVRDNCLELLTIFSQATDKKNNINLHYDVLLEKCYALLGSYKGCEGGSKLAEFLFIVSTNKPSVIQNLLDKLSQRIESSNHNLIANFSKSVHGYFLALSLLLHKSDFIRELGDIEATIDTCIRLIALNWATVEHILCDDPFENQKDCMKAGFDVSDPQVITYAFRSIKDSAELLRTIIGIPSLSESQLVSCGELMLEQLATIRHSGAFQSVVPSFVACCQRCYQQCPKITEIWLHRMLGLLEKKTQFITRRSGGVPHIICSIVSPETAVKRPLLKLTFDHLFKIAKIPVSEHEERNDLPQVNAFNCIKVLFIESTLSDACAPFVYPALALCLRSFTSPLWSLRNCSFMLFSALQNRLFGKSGKSVSARLFFSRYEGVQSSLREQFEKSLNKSLLIQGTRESGTDLPTLDSQIESIFLVLTILSRLKQTPGFDGLADFKKLVVLCLESQNWTVRQLAARTLPNLVNDSSAEILNLVRNLQLSGLKQNTAHGYILAIHEFLGSEDNQFLSGTELAYMVNSIVDLAGSFIFENKCFVTAKAFVSLVDICLSKGALSTAEGKRLTSQLGTYFLKLNDDYSMDGTKQLLLKELFSILTKRESKDNLLDLTAVALLSPFYEVQIAAAEYVAQNENLNIGKESVIAEILLELFFEEKVWNHIKLSVLRALITLKVTIDVKKLMALIEETHSDDLRATALEYAGLFVGAGDNLYRGLVEKLSRDEIPFELRKSALVSLTNATNRFPDVKMFFVISRFLYDDDLVLRETSSTHLNRVLFKTDTVSLGTAFPVTANLFVAHMQNNPEAHAIAFAAVKGDLEPLTSQTCWEKDEEADELFEVEPENQFRNFVEEGLRHVELLRHAKDLKEELHSFVLSLVLVLNRRMYHYVVKDAPLGWGSNYKLFGQLVILRKLALSLEITEIELLDQHLTSLDCHPSVFELSSGSA
ncbi:LADA_0H05974g1_1 [Lachancea dasiensis]|uniref:LADA_0H05974g1_1 n=1 Tax=Lachancea dasiensis TaxID=1072105 RepID=A0A1G4K1P5_9SACH|nr:LADA_0H05974g1_1 [Lachancea dasiensis]